MSLEKGSVGFKSEDCYLSRKSRVKVVVCVALLAFILRHNDVETSRTLAALRLLSISLKGWKMVFTWFVDFVFDIRIPLQ